MYLSNMFSINHVLYIIHTYSLIFIHCNCVAILYRYLMATANVTEQTPLDVIRGEIIQVFERILSEVRARRDELLEQVSKMKIEFGAKNISVVESMRGLTEMRAQVEKMSVKQNLAMKKQQESLADIDSEIEKLMIELSNKSKFRFNCSINQLIERVKQFGEVIDESCVITQYQSKLTATQIITVIQDSRFFDCSFKLHIDHDRQLLYVLNSNLTRKAEAVRPMHHTPPAVPHEICIAVFNANDFTFIVQFGGSEYFTDCIATSQEFVYVGHSRHSKYIPSQLIQFKNSDYSIVKTLSTSSIGIMCPENLVYVLTSDRTFKFQIYDRALNFKEERDLCYEWPKYTHIISAKQIQKLFYIFFNEQLLVFTKEGRNIHSIILGEGKSIFSCCHCDE